MPYSLLSPTPDTPSTPQPPDLVLAQEQQWLRDCARQGRAGAHLWQASQCLIVTRKDMRLPHYQSACEQLAAEGWPVYVRDSGGTAVPHGAGILNLSLLLPRTTTDLGHYYQLLGAPLLALLADYGLQGGYDFVPGSFCDGQYNLVIGGRKITGTAQRWLAPAQDHRGAVLAQAMLLVAGIWTRGPGWRAASMSWRAGSCASCPAPPPRWHSRSVGRAVPRSWWRRSGGGCRRC